MPPLPTMTTPLRIGITLGDPGGIGPEVTAKALARPAIRRLADFVIIGSEEPYRLYQPQKYSNCTVIPISRSGRLTIGRPDPVNARTALDSLLRAVELLRRRDIQALVTAPVCKESLSNLGQEFQGHTEYLARSFGINEYEMMFVSGRLRTVIVTRHTPLQNVSRELTVPKVYQAIRITAQALTYHFRIKRPRLAVCGLNPHAGEGGKIGREELEVIIPAVRKARQAGLDVTGPCAADTLFTPEKIRLFDATIAMYHDQGLIPVKSLAFQTVVNLTIGLPFVRTSPAHGTAFDIAGRNRAQPESMSAAIELAANLARKSHKR